MGRDGRGSERITASVPREMKERLDQLAERHGVSVAWLQRRAIQDLLDDPGSAGPLKDDHDA